MYVYADAFQKACLLERAPAAQHGVPHDGVLLVKEMEIIYVCTKNP